MATVTDGFSYSDGVLSTVSAGVWTVLEGNISYQTVSSGQLVQSTDSAVSSLYHTGVSAGASQYAQAKFVSSANPDTYVAVRMSSAGNYYVGGPQNSTTVRIGKRVSGAFTTIDSAAYSIQAGDVFRLEIDSSNYLSLYVNGELKVGPVLDPGSSHSSGYVGLQSYKQAVLDDFEAGDLSAVSTYPQNRGRLIGTGTIGHGNGFGYKRF